MKSSPMFAVHSISEGRQGIFVGHEIIVKLYFEIRQRGTVNGDLDSILLSATFRNTAM